MPVKIDSREYRRINAAEMETRAEEDGRRIVEGYATTFNQPYELMRTKDMIVKEQVDPEAFSETDMSDTIMQYDHQGRVFARVKNGTLRLEPDAHGLKVIADLGGTEIGRQLYEEIRGGYTDKMSFGFTIDRTEETRTDLENGAIDVLIRILRVAKLYDVSAVSIPANDGTSIGVETRNQIDGVIERARAERLEKAKLELKKRIIKKGL